MIEVMPQMPAGTIGVRASGKITDEGYRDVLVPALGDALQRGEVRLLYVLEKDFAYSAGAAWEDTKLWARHLTGWQKSPWSPTPTGSSTASRPSVG